MRDLFFFVGTEAELIKVFPVMLECNKRGIDYHVIASGQNNIKDSVIFSKTPCRKIELELSREEDLRKSPLGLFNWWIATYRNACNEIRKAFAGCDLNNAYMIVHGDTVSTYMGARIGRRLGMTVCHIEAGLRSHHLFNPFPEEIDRLLTSRVADVHYAPGQTATANLEGVKGRVVNTRQNTLRDSLRVSESIDACDEIKNILSDKRPYFVFVMHRQENLANIKLVKAAVDNVISISEHCRCILILHVITGKTFEKLGLMDRLNDNPNIVLLPRVDYFSFMKLLMNSEFVVTDGGSNQEELSYMGKPTLILRKTTERNEGIGRNAMLYSDISDMKSFYERYREYICHDESADDPSGIIVDDLMSR